jgi:hypothetical protein
MSTLTIELPSQKVQTAFNLQRWAELLNDPELAKIDARIETDRFGHIIMTPSSCSRPWQLSKRGCFFAADIASEWARPYRVPYLHG